MNFSRGMGDSNCVPSPYLYPNSIPNNENKLQLSNIYDILEMHLKYSTIMPEGLENIYTNISLTPLR